MKTQFLPFLIFAALFLVSLLWDLGLIGRVALLVMACCLAGRVGFLIGTRHGHRK